MAIRVLLVDDHEMVRHALRALLSRTADILVVGEAADGKQALARVDDLEPDMVLLDLVMPGWSGAETARRILTEHPSTRVLILTGREDVLDLDEVRKAGVSGCLLKTSAFHELSTAIRTVAAGREYTSPTLRKPRPVVVPPPAAPEALSDLSPRELQVLKLLADGQTTEQIAQQLFLSPKTIETHRARLIRKLGTRSIARLTKIAVREGLSEIDE